MTTAPPTEQEEPAGAPPCLICQKPATWTSPTGHQFCENCRDLYQSVYPVNGGTLDELLQKDLPPIRWTVQGMIPEGLTMLAGKPKLGKSWLALVLALAVATGKDFLGYPTVGGEVLYIALEDSERRMQERATFLGAQTMGIGLRRFHYRTEWPSLEREGLGELEKWMTEHPDTKLVIVDTFGKLRGDLPGRDKYAEEYNLLGMIQTFALKHGIAVILVHHLRKMGADDWIEQLSGSQAISGAADTILGLYRERGQMDAVLRSVSRDVEDLELAMLFNGGRWEYMGPAEEYRRSQEQTAALEAIKDLGGEAKVSEIAMLLDKSQPATSKLLAKLTTDGVIQRTRYGVYSAGIVGIVVQSETPEMPTKNQSTSPTITTMPDRAIGTIPGMPDRSKRGSEEDSGNSSLFTESGHDFDDYDPDPDDLPDPFEEPV